MSSALRVGAFSAQSALNAPRRTTSIGPRRRRSDDRHPIALPPIGSASIAWSARIDFSGPADGSSEQVANVMLEHTRGAAVIFGSRTITLWLNVHAATYAEGWRAVERRLAPVNRPVWKISRAQLQRFDLVDDKCDRPLIPPLVGITETAAILGVSRQGALAIARREGFPASVAAIASGPVFLEYDVRAFADRPHRVGWPLYG